VGEDDLKPAVETAVGLAAGGWSGCSWKRKKRKQSAEGRETFKVAYYRRSGGWPVVLATRGGAGCSRRSWRKRR